MKAMQRPSSTWSTFLPAMPGINVAFMSMPCLLLKLRLPHARRLRRELEVEIDPPDLAPVRGLDLHLPAAGLVIRLEPVAAEALLAAADDADRDRVLQRPAADAAARAPVPAHLHLVGEKMRKNTYTLSPGCARNAWSPWCQKRHHSRSWVRR